MDEAKSGLRIDLSRVTAGEMHAFVTAARAQDIRVMAETFARVVTACPWGDPADPATYLALPFYGAFQEVIAALGQAARDFPTPSRGPST